MDYPHYAASVMSSSICTQVCRIFWIPPCTVCTGAAHLRAGLHGGCTPACKGVAHLRARPARGLHTCVHGLHAGVQLEGRCTQVCSRLCTQVCTLHAGVQPPCSLANSRATSVQAPARRCAGPVQSPARWCAGSEQLACTQVCNLRAAPARRCAGPLESPARRCAGPLHCPARRCADPLRCAGPEQPPCTQPCRPLGS